MERFSPGHHTIFVTLAGSRAYGTSRDESDVDLRGVGIQPLRQRFSYRERFEQYEGPCTERLRMTVGPELERRGIDPADEAVETIIYDVSKFVRLCAANNPNALEILFSHRDDWLFETPAWRAIWDRRKQFLCREVARTFSGYAMSQLRKIRAHRRQRGLKTGHGPARRERMEKHGYDTKHAMHLVRVLRTGLELLETGELNVRRPDADELLAILDGAYSYRKLAEEAKRLEEKVAEAVATSPLSPEIDHETIDDTLFRVIDRFSSRA